MSSIRISTFLVSAFSIFPESTESSYQSDCQGRKWVSDWVERMKIVLSSCRLWRRRKSADDNNPSVSEWLGEWKVIEGKWRRPRTTSTYVSQTFRFRKEIENYMNTKLSRWWYLWLSERMWIRNSSRMSTNKFWTRKLKCLLFVEVFSKKASSESMSKARPCRNIRVLSIFQG